MLLQFGQGPLGRVARAIGAMREGKPLILVDDESRENEGDLILAAEKVTPENMNFMIRNGSGIVCLCITEKRRQDLALPMMVSDNNNQFGTAFTVSIEAKTGVSTGVSAADRVRTILVATDDSSQPADLARPGHVFPLRAQDGGVLERPGHTEGSVDLARIAGFKSAAVLCELMNPDGTMSRLAEIVEFAKKHCLCVLSIPDIIAYRQHHGC